MTYTILARCPQTGAFGIGIATYSICVGAFCPGIVAGVGAITSQSNVNPELRRLGLNLLSQGYSAQHALATLLQADPNIQYRQIGIVDSEGRTAVHSGSMTRQCSNHADGPGFLALGNVLANADVVKAMADGFVRSDGRSLSERLLVALEGGRDAGGQSGANGHLPERSAVVLTRGPDPSLDGDYRSDNNPTAVEDLRRIHDLYQPYIAYHRQRWLDPASALPQEAFVRSLEERAGARQA